MNLYFAQEFYDHTYVQGTDNAAAPGRMQAIMEYQAMKAWPTQRPIMATEADILRAHPQSVLDEVKQQPKLYNMAMLSAGSALAAARSAKANTPAFSVARPPGHHAGVSKHWGFCYFNNMAVAMLSLLNTGQANNVLIIDIDEHLGDGTKDILDSDNRVTIYNPVAANRQQYLSAVEHFCQEAKPVDIIGICAGFDTYEKDVGRKLQTYDYYHIGFTVKLLCRRLGHNRRFAVLEGGYYQPDLGKNVAAFCQGFE